MRLEKTLSSGADLREQEPAARNGGQENEMLVKLGGALSRLAELVFRRFLTAVRTAGHFFRSENGAFQVGERGFSPVRYP